MTDDTSAFHSSKFIKWHESFNRFTRVTHYFEDAMMTLFNDLPYTLHSESLKCRCTKGLRRVEGGCAPTLTLH